MVTEEEFMLILRYIQQKKTTSFPPILKKDGTDKSESAETL